MATPHPRSRIDSTQEHGTGFKDITGQRFARLTVIRQDGNKPKRYKDKVIKGSAVWLCQCTCGKTAKVATYQLTTGRVKSCGCFNTEKRFKHGMARSRTYKIWSGMKSRCQYQRNKHYNLYGGRGITVCERWQTFEHFLTDMGEAPKGYSIERIDVNGHYCPENCKWATSYQQSRNRRTNHIIEFDGKTRVITDWAKEYETDPQTIDRRLNEGWSMEQSLGIEPTPPLYRIVLTPEQTRMISDEYQKGATIDEIITKYFLRKTRVKIRLTANDNHVPDCVKAIQDSLNDFFQK